MTNQKQETNSMTKEEHSYTVGLYLDRCVQHSKTIFDEVDAKQYGYKADRVLHTEDLLEIYMHPQAWSDTTCGFGGVGGQQISCSNTVVIISAVFNIACVYNGRFAYSVKNLSEKFYQDLHSHTLCGANQHHIIAEYSRG